MFNNCQSIDITGFLKHANPRVVISEPSVPELIDMAIFEIGSRIQAAKKLELNPKTLAEYHKGRNYIDYNTLVKIMEYTNERELKIEVIKAERSSKLVKLPVYIDKKLAELIGLILANGHVKRNRELHFLHRRAYTRDRFTHLIREIFNLESKEYNNGSVIGSKVNSKILVDFLIWIGIPQSTRSSNCDLTSLIRLSSSTEFFISFLNGFIECDGEIKDTRLKLVFDNPFLYNQIQDALSDLNIPFNSQIKSEKKRGQFNINFVDEGVIKLFRLIKDEFPYYNLQKLIELSEIQV